MSLPRRLAARLPAHYDPASIDVEEHAPWLIACSLEEGDSEDLTRLVEHFGAGRLRRWLVERGARQLSARSLAFWTLVLGAPVGSAAAGEALWPR